MELLISSLVGGIVGLLLGIIFEEPLNAAKRALLSRLRSLIHRRRALPSPETLKLGPTRTSWLVIDGDGELAYVPENIRCIVQPSPITLPPEIQDLRDRIAERERSNKEHGLPYLWNGPLYALERYAIGRTPSQEHMEGTFTFRPTDYFTFQATVCSLDVNLMAPPANLTIRQKYLQGIDLARPIAYLANGFGVAIAVVTVDRKTIITRRHDTTGTRSGEVDVAVVEGVHPNLDWSTTYKGPDLYQTAIRGAREELGIEILQDSITLLGFGVDAEYYQWNLIGLTVVDETAESIIENRKKGAPGKWELRSLEAVDFDPESIFSFLKRERLWSTGLATLYFALVRQYGRSRVDRMATRLLAR
jgi:hypothetical protein